jgi:hypothetical protein
MRVQNQMQIPRVMAAGLVIASALFAISPAAAGDREICTDSLRSEVAIAACTRAIASGQYTIAVGGGWGADGRMAKSRDHGVAKHGGCEMSNLCETPDRWLWRAQVAA